MKLDRKIQNYLLCKYFKGKNRFARILDAVLGRILLLLALFVVFWLLGAGLLNSLIFSLTAAAAISIGIVMIRRYRQDNFFSAEIERVRKECMLEKLTLLSREDFQKICYSVFKSHTGLASFKRILGGYFNVREKVFCYAFSNHPDNPVGVQQMLLLYRKLKKLNASSAVILSAAAYVEEANAMSGRLGIEIELLGKDEFLQSAGNPKLSVSEDEILTAIQAEMSARVTRDQLKQSFFAKSKQKAYLLCAALLTLWTFVIGFNLIYPIVAAICVLLSFYTYFSQKRREKRESSVGG